MGVMSRFNPRLVAIFLIGFVGFTAFHLVRSNTERWRKFTASDNTKITAFALLGHEDYADKDAKWRTAQKKFRGEIILSQAPVEDANICRELRQTFTRIVPAEYGADCIPNYRHGLRFEKDGRTVDSIICFACGQISVVDSTGKNADFDFNLPYEQGRDKFDAIFARLGMKQFRPYAKQ